MDILCAEKPPWRYTQWVKSPPAVPPVSFQAWTTEPNQEVLALKESIGALDREHKWELAKKMVNPYELVYTQNDDRLPPALALKQPLSRSYFKMVEMMEVLGIFAQPTKLRSAHVAEGPGGFIQALVERAGEKGSQVLAATAMTLKPSTTHVPGWRKAAQFLQKNRQVTVHYGADGTGNIYVPANQESFIAACAPGVNLFTADGGFDFSVNYSQQEFKVFHLLLCSASIGLRVLRQGGSFVLKLFDLESPHTRTLVLLLGRHFTEWTLYKPAMTRTCNSERYFLGRGFRGTMNPIILEAQEKSAAGLYPVMDTATWTVTESAFLASHVETTTALQLHSIRQAIVFSQDPELWRRTWHRACIQKSYSWCEAFRIPAKPLAEFIRAS